MQELSKTITITGGSLLLVAILPLSYGYYTFLRLAIFISGSFLAHKLHEQKQSGWAIGLAVIALLFNPIIPVYLTKETWILIDLISAGLFFYLVVKKDHDD